MTDNEKLIEDTQILQKNCEHKFSPVGCNCIFARGRYCTLEGAHYYPKDWAVPKPRRFTDADIALAKALKSFGYDKVTRYEDEKYCTATNRCDGDDVYLPIKAFKNIEYDRTVLIDDIIKEGE